MKIDIWSDIRCPFCYIGKRKFESALAVFKEKDKVEVIWHSFELDPSLKTNTTIDLYDYLAEIKGQSRDWALKVHRQVSESGKAVGIDFNFDMTVISNSFNAHRLVQLAKSKNLGSTAEEALFRAYFSLGKNIDDHNTLIELGTTLGLNSQDIGSMLSSDDYKNEVYQDEAQASALGISGVPFFILNDHYSISGAQSPEFFLAALNQTWEEYMLAEPPSF